MRFATRGTESREHLDALILEWRVAVDRVGETDTSLLAFGTRDSQSVVLKPIKVPGNEWRSGELLSAFAGRGVVCALELGDGAVLLEQLRPGESLAARSLQDEDDRATSTLADTIAQMSPQACPDWVPAVEDWGASFKSHLIGRDAQLPAALVSTAARIYVDLCASQDDVKLLHGDLHHENLLFDDTRGWLAIDPKGVRGELEYEIGAAMRNPCDHSDRFAQPRGHSPASRPVRTDAGRRPRAGAAMGVRSGGAGCHLGDRGRDADRT